VHCQREKLWLKTMIRMDVAGERFGCFESCPQRFPTVAGIFYTLLLPWFSEKEGAYVLFLHISPWFLGAACQNWTDDLLITNILQST